MLSFMSGRRRHSPCACFHSLGQPSKPSSLTQLQYHAPRGRNFRYNWPCIADLMHGTHLEGLSSDTGPFLTASSRFEVSRLPYEWKIRETGIGNVRGQWRLHVTCRELAQRVRDALVPYQCTYPDRAPAKSRPQYGWFLGLAMPNKTRSALFGNVLPQPNPGSDKNGATGDAFLERSAGVY